MDYICKYIGEIWNFLVILITFLSYMLHPTIFIFTDVLKKYSGKNIHETKKF